MISKALIALSAAAGVFGAVTELGKVNVLTDSNFDGFLSENDNGALVEFYAPWCGHCKKLEPEFDAAAKTMNDDGVKIPLGKVDATVETKLAGKFEVNGYPTLKYFVGGKPTDYDGPREAKGIVAWIKSMSGPAVEEGEPKESDALSVTYYGSEIPDAFSALAKNQRKKASWHFVKSDDTKVVLKHKGEPALESTDSEYEKFFTDNKFPFYGDLNGDTFSQYIDRGNGLIWILLPMTKENKEEVVEESRAVYTEVAKELGSKYSVTHTNTFEFGKVLESMFGITEFPKVVIQKKAGDKKNFIYEGDMDQKSLLDYVSKIDSGEIVPNLKSEPVPDAEKEAKEPVKTVVGKNLEEVVFNADKDVLLEIYAPWCGHCKKLEPEYTKVGKKVIKEGLEDIVTIAKMDGTLNDSPVDALTWSGFPTLYYIKAGASEPSKYDGPREAKGIWKWIKKNHSKADTIKERIASKASDKKEEL
jgi:protein disulfide-isomerase/protein disulfide-isomerase A1